MRDELSALYVPQVEQLGVALRPCGGDESVLVGNASNEMADATVCVQRLGSYGVITSHRVHMKRDMLFWEHGLTGLCICTLSADSLKLCPIAQPSTTRATGNVAIFGQEDVERASPLKAGSAQNAISITLLPAWFHHLTADHVRTAWSLIDNVSETCPTDIGHALDALMRMVSPVFGGRLATGAALHARAVRIVDDVFEWHAAREQAEAALGTLRQAQLVRTTQRHIARHLAEPLSLDTLARDLLTSRTQLCAAFRQETGESLGSYIKRVRMERARLLLEASTHPVADVARLVGYSRVSSFTVAFERATGCSPTAWRANDATREALPAAGSAEEV